MRLCRKLEFNSRFSRTLGRIPQKIRLGNGITLVFYINAFTLDFGFLLRDKDPQNLAGAQNQALKLERNINVVGKKEATKSIGSQGYKEKVLMDSTLEPSKDKIEHMIKDFDKFANVMQALRNNMIKMERNQQGTTSAICPFHPRE